MDGYAGFDHPGLSAHHGEVMATPMRRAALHRDRVAGRAGGDCGVIAVAAALRVPCAEALAVLGREARSRVSLVAVQERLRAAGWRVGESEYLAPERVPLRRADERLPRGRWIVVTAPAAGAGHLAAVVDGVVDDHAAGTGEVVVLAMRFWGRRRQAPESGEQVVAVTLIEEG